jgi:hypothetical protein
MSVRARMCMHAWVCECVSESDECTEFGCTSDFLNKKCGSSETNAVGMVDG